MALTLRQKQSAFSLLVARLITYIYSQGYEATLGEAYRSPQEAARLAKLGSGIPNSLHCLKLAIDINLFRDGVYLSSTDSHRLIGEWWESQSDPDNGIICCWGGRFGDGNHYSISHGGRR